MNHFGVDISSNNGFPRTQQNWNTIYATMKAAGGGAEPFVIIKISESTWYTNPSAAADVAMARAAGFKAVAGYLFDHGTDVPGTEEQWFQAHSLGLPQANDFEFPNGLNAQQYAAHAQALIAYDPSALTYLNQAEVTSGMPTPNLWLAQYDGNTTTSRWPCVVKQFTDAYSVPGVGTFDGNVWLGTEALFDTFFRITTPTPGGHVVMLTNGVGMMVDPKGRGYWLVQADGGVFTHSVAGQTLPFFGSAGATHLNQPMVDGVPSPTGGGYWLASADGGVFTFGDARFFGSLGSIKLNAPVRRIVATATGQGYWLFASDGGVFTFGDARFAGAGE